MTTKRKSFKDYLQIKPLGKLNMDIKRYPTGVPALDEALEGGLPAGEIVEIAGEPNTFKSSISLLTAKNILEAGGRVLYIDLEGTINPRNRMHYNLDGYIQSGMFDHVTGVFAEEVFDGITCAVDERLYDLIVIDSIAALATRGELDGEAADANIASVARLISRFGKKMVNKLNVGEKCDTTVIMINQFRANIGAFANAPDKITTGGRAIAYYASLRFTVSHFGKLKDKDKLQIGQKMKFDVTKSRTSQQYATGYFEFYAKSGIDTIGSLIDVCVEKGFIVGGTGGRYVVEGESIHGKDKTRKFLMENPDVMNTLKAKVNSRLSEVVVENDEEVDEVENYDNNES